MTELDDMLRGSFGRIAEPGDPAGVAAAIQSRVDAGDTGTPATSSGFGSSAGWVIPWVFGGALLAIGGLALGMSGLLPSPYGPAQTAGTSVLLSTADVLDCPGGAPVGTLAAGNRVLAIARSDDGAYLGIRSPYDTSTTVWLSSALLIVDDGETSVGDLPVDSCPVAQTTEVEPTAGPTEEPSDEPTEEPAKEPTPGPTPPPAPAADTTKPTLGTPTATPNSDVCADDSYSAYYAVSSVIAVTAADNIAVAGVNISWFGAATGSGVMSGGPTSWSYTYNPAQSTPTGTVTFVLQAFDAAGNLSGAKQTSVGVINSGSCLI